MIIVYALLLIARPVANPYTLGKSWAYAAAGWNVARLSESRLRMPDSESQATGHFQPASSPATQSPAVDRCDNQLGLPISCSDDFISLSKALTLGDQELSKTLSSMDL